MVQHTDGVARIPVDGVELEATFDVPQGASGVVVFAHGSGSSRKSPRNNYVAEVIRERGLGTLLFDLLTEAEDQQRQNRFDISLLTDRLVWVTEWVWKQDPELSVGYFGSSTGAATALRGAARYGEDVDGVVSRGGRVDMAADSLSDVTAPTLFVVGGADSEVLALNREAYERLTCDRSLHVVAGAGHLFEAEDELREVATVAADWFESKLR
ncbi:dienelactone hydrolase family protein [Haloarcula salinisoli]|uniref:Dienelactone hydrolase family protein n=1 Tax=Haloarcula salinisoli TaxID=2487746 RepID=A0A8J7YND6_9EURY|nr:alpha/beta family hydrolase [Halomicroarcula salinisoli]MBX0288283.1 dienelactone hydrolase family protein [Halomicroarcula salinisoli]MBX0305944.1 dienelactone hydrolase family protein [Halomicroarcula salinisoli]